MDKYMFDVVHFLAESGIDSSMKQIVGDIMSAGRGAVNAEQADMALRYLNILAEKGDHSALLSLGALHYTGLGDFIPQDYVKAMHYYEKAAELSELKDEWALNNLGYCHYYGRAGNVDYEKAYACFALSAMHGNPNAMYKLGDMYYHGNHVEKDLSASFYWYSLAKAQKPDSDVDYQGFLVASIAMRLGRAFLYGEGTDVDLIFALFELRTAETLFYKQILIGNEFSIGQLPKVKRLIEAAQEELDKMIC